MTSNDAVTKMVHYQPGQVIIKEGSLAKELFVLMSGKLVVTTKGTTIAEISARGSYVGEIAALLGSRRAATVTAVVESKLMKIENVTRHFEENPASAMSIAQALAARIMDMNTRLVTFRSEVARLVQKGKSALKGEDIAPLESIIGEMETLLLDGRSTQEKT